MTRKTSRPYKWHARRFSHGDLGESQNYFPAIRATKHIQQVLGCVVRCFSIRSCAGDRKADLKVALHLVLRLRIEYEQYAMNCFRQLKCQKAAGPADRAANRPVA